MADILNLQSDEQQPAEEKGSYASYFICHNSGTSNFLCWHP